MGNLWFGRPHSPKHKFPIHATRNFQRQLKSTVHYITELSIGHSKAKSTFTKKLLTSSQLPEMDWGRGGGEKASFCSLLFYLQTLSSKLGTQTRKSVYLLIHVQATQHMPTKKLWNYHHNHDNSWWMGDIPLIPQDCRTTSMWLTTKLATNLSATVRCSN